MIAINLNNCEATESCNDGGRRKSSHDIRRHANLVKGWASFHKAGEYRKWNRTLRNMATGHSHLALFDVAPPYIYGQVTPLQTRSAGP